MNLVNMSPPRALLASLMVLIAIPPTSAPQSQAPPAAHDDSILQRRYDAAQKFQAAGDLDHAAQQYRIFIADALGEFALGHARAGQYNKAANDFDTALSLVPDFPAMKIQYARVALDSGNFDHAKLLASGVIQDYPNNPKVAADAHAILGRVLLKTNEDTKAKEQFEAAVALDPTFENGYELAVADLDLGDGPGATKIFSEMLASFGDTAAIHMYFGQAYGRSDFQDDAVAEFKKAIAADDKLPGIHYSLAAAYLSTSGNSKLPEAEAELKKEIALSPKYAASYAALGHLLAQQHDPATQLEAETDLKRATELDPTSPDGFLYLGQFYSDAHKLPEAEAALRQSIALPGAESTLSPRTAAHANRPARGREAGDRNLSITAAAESSARPKPAIRLSADQTSRADRLHTGSRNAHDGRRSHRRSRSRTPGRSAREATWSRHRRQL